MMIRGTLSDVLKSTTVLFPSQMPMSDELGRGRWPTGRKRGVPGEDVEARGCKLSVRSPPNARGCQIAGKSKRFDVFCGWTRSSNQRSPLIPFRHLVDYITAWALQALERLCALCRQDIVAPFTLQPGSNWQFDILRIPASFFVALLLYDGRQKPFLTSISHQPHASSHPATGPQSLPLHFRQVFRMR